MEGTRKQLGGDKTLRIGGSRHSGTGKKEHGTSQSGVRGASHILLAVERSPGLLSTYVAQQREPSRAGYQADQPSPLPRTEVVTGTRGFQTYKWPSPAQTGLSWAPWLELFLSSYGNQVQTSQPPLC